MVAESNPARRRADSTAGPDSSARTPRRGITAAARRRGLPVLVALALATVAGAGVGSGVADPAVASPAPMQATAAVAETSGLHVRVSPTISTTLVFNAPVTLSVEIENATGEALAPGAVRLVRASEAIDAEAEIDAWLAADADGAPGINAGSVPLAEGESRALSAGAASVVSFTVPAEAFAEIADSPVIGLGAELVVGDTVVASGTGTFANSGVAPAGSVALAVAAPLTVPTTGEAVGLIDAERLESWTGPTGLLTRQLDALAGRRVAIGVDPRIIASIRVLGTSAPPSATDWLERLANVPNEVFPLAYADADLAAQAQLGLPGLLAPISFSDALDPANFAATADGATPTPAPGEPTATPAPTPGGLPSTEELLAWPYTRTDIAWPADDTVRTGDLSVFDAAGLTTAILAPGNVEPLDTPASASATIDGSTALAADADLTRPLRAAAAATTDTGWRAATGQLLAELALDAGAARTTVLATLDRGAGSQSARVAAVLDEIAASGWSSLAGLADAIGAPPQARTLVDRSETEDRLGAVGRMVDMEAELTEFASVLSDERLLTGPTRREVLSLLDGAWLADAQAWSSVVSDWMATQRQVLGGVSVVPSSPILVVSSETGVPMSVENSLPYPVTVVVSVDPSNGRLVVEDRMEIMVEAGSRSSVRVPVVAGVGNGDVTLAVSLSSLSGVPIGGTVTIPANVQADWEGLGAGIIATIVVLVFGIGIWRNIRRRRRERDTSENAPAAADADAATDAAAATDGGPDQATDAAGPQTDAADAGPQTGAAPEPAPAEDGHRG